MTHVIPVELGARGYDVIVGRDLLPALGQHTARSPDARRAVIVTQPPVAERYAATVRDALQQGGLEATCVVVPDGERAKDLETLGHLYRELAGIPLARTDLVVALGGGVVGDLAGFLAATWHRGVAVLQIPTTLLAQVDAAIGGKTAVNLPEGKNLVGAFHQPIAVVADVDTLATLPERERTAGLGEVVKCGLIRDPSILDLLEADPRAARDGDPGLLVELVRRCVAVKAAVVAADETEGGERAILNLGHTYGHAVEAVTGYGHHLHGEAVAIGTVAALRIGAALDLTPPDLVERAESLLTALGLPVRSAPLDREAVWAAMARDKKARASARDEARASAQDAVRDGVRFVLLEALGRPVVTTPPAHVIDTVLDEVETAGS